MAAEVWLPQEYNRPRNLQRPPARTRQRPITKKQVIPFISTYYSNYDSSNIIEVAKNLIGNSKNPRIQQVFENVQLIHAIRQPPNILRQITSASFINGNYKSRDAGIFRCQRPNCKVCILYLQECKSFNTMKCLWTVKCYADCHSINAIYYQLCNFCSAESNLGKTNDIRQRTNNQVAADWVQVMIDSTDIVMSAQESRELSENNLILHLQN